MNGTWMGEHEHGTRHSTAWAIVAIVLGVAAVVLPTAFGIGISFAVAWVITLAGLAYLVFAFGAARARSFVLRLLVGLMYTAGGIYLLYHPMLTLATLTLLLAVFFLAEGVFELIVYFRMRAMGGSGWLLVDAVFSFLLAYLIGRPWPGSSSWAVGIIVGVNLIMGGMLRLMYARAVRKLEL